MTANAKPAGQEAEKKGFLKGFLNRLSLRNKIIGVAVLVFLVLLVISIPSDQSQLLARQERVDAAQIAYDLALPAVDPMMASVIGSSYCTARTTDSGLPPTPIQVFSVPFSTCG